MLNILKNLKRSTKIKLMISLGSFSLATVLLLSVCVFNVFLLIAAFGYFFGGCVLGDLLADTTNGDN
jgi:hypothetical protein